MFENWKERKEHLYKEVAHIILFWVSMAFTVMLFYQFTSNPVGRVIWVSMAIAIELLKNYLIKKIKTIYKGKNTPIIAGYFFIYFLTAVVSGICTYGSVKLTLENQELYVSKMNIDTENIQFQIDQIDIKIERLNRSADASVAEKEKMSGLDGAYYSGQTKMTDDLNSVDSNMQKLLDDRTALTNSLKVEAQNIDSVSKDVFTLIGEDIGLTGTQTLFWIFIVLIVILEVALYVTTDGFKYSEVEEEVLTEKDVIFMYIDALENSNSVVLPSDNTISEATQISKSDCKRYRALLSELKWRGKPLIMNGGSGYRANFNGSTMKKVVGEYFEPIVKEENV